MYYLMIKEAKETGLKYLCKTSKKDPYTYPGSGTRWRLHLEKHNPTILTTILGQFETNEQLKQAGLYYSKLYDVVKSDAWANLTEEKGDGGLIGTGQLGKRWKCRENRKHMGSKPGYKRPKEASMKIAGEKNYQFRGYYLTPWGEFPSIVEAIAKAKELRKLGNKLVVSDPASLRKYCLSGDIKLNSEGRRTPPSWRGKTPAELGFGFREKE